MKVATAAVALGILALLSLAGPPVGRATDMEDYRWDHDRPNCRVVETQTTNRWGTDVTVHRRICG